MNPNLFSVLLALTLTAGMPLAAAQSAEPETLFRNVRVFDGTTPQLSNPTDVLVRGNKIAAVGGGANSSMNATVIEGGGRTLMPGLIDAHTHLMLASLPLLTVMTSDIGFVNLAAGKAASDMMMRGYTSVRDLGGPVFGLKRAIDSGLVVGAPGLAFRSLHFSDRRSWRLPPADRPSGATRRL